MIEMLTEEEVKERVARLMLERKHWLFLPGFSGSRALIEIEETFYEGEKNNDFDIMMATLPEPATIPILAIAFAHKKHLSPAALAKYINEHIEDLPPALRLTEQMVTDRDVIFLAQPEESLVVANDFHHWIKPALERIEAELIFGNELDVNQKENE